MKSYPSIPSSNGNSFREIPNAYIFDKIDGSNLRFEWSRKGGWYKYGTRSRLFDKTDEVFGCAIDIFNDTIAAYVTKVAKKSNWSHVVAFAEFWGEHSFAGVHRYEDEKHLTLFDIAANKQGLIGPSRFMDLFSDFPYRVKCLGRCNWTRGFVQSVREGKYNNDITFEGVVAKSGEKHKLVMAKAKTQKWIDAVKAKYPPEDAEKILQS